MNRNVIEGGLMHDNRGVFLPLFLRCFKHNLLIVGVVVVAAAVVTSTTVMLLLLPIQLVKLGKEYFSVNARMLVRRGRLLLLVGDEESEVGAQIRRKHLVSVGWTVKREETVLVDDDTRR